MNQPFASNTAPPQAEAQKEEMRLDYKSVWQPVPPQCILRELKPCAHINKAANHVKLLPN
jgi:hypothetical protein